jgi:hypothetical protein
VCLFVEFGRHGSKVFVWVVHFYVKDVLFLKKYINGSVCWLGVATT